MAQRIKEMQQFLVWFLLFSIFFVTGFGYLSFFRDCKKEKRERLEGKRLFIRQGRDGSTMRLCFSNTCVVTSTYALSENIPPSLYLPLYPSVRNLEKVLFKNEEEAVSGRKKSQ